MSKAKNYKISAVVPVYNNDKTVKKVIKVLLSCSVLNQLIVVNDGSTDKSLKILNKFKHPKLKLLNLKTNHGKGAAIEKALDFVIHSVVMIVDADLTSLKKSHILDLKNYFFQSKSDMVIAARKCRFQVGPFDSLSGERIFYKKNIEPYRFLLQKVNYGFEQVVNFAHRNKKVKRIYSENIGHILKLNKYRGRYIYKIPISYAKEGWDICKTAILLQIFAYLKF